MSYLTQYALSRPVSAQPARRGARVDEQIVLNLPDYDGGAHVRVLVEDTSTRRVRRRRLPSPRLKLRIADCTNEIHLEFSVDSAELRENSLHKMDTLLDALERFRDGLLAEAELRESRERPCTPDPIREKEVNDVVPAALRHTASPAVGADPGLGPGPELGRRLRLGGRRLDAAQPLPRPRLGGRQLLRLGADAHTQEREGGPALPRGGRPAGGRRRSCA